MEKQKIDLRRAAFWGIGLGLLLVVTTSVVISYIVEYKSSSQPSDIPIRSPDFPKRGSVIESVEHSRPKTAEGYRNRAFANNFDGKHTQAIRDYKTAIRLDPKNVELYRELALTYEELEKPDQALTSYNSAILLEPGDAQMYLGRGRAYALRGELKKAIIDWKRFLRLHKPESVKDNMDDIVRSNILQYEKKIAERAKNRKR